MSESLMGVHTHTHTGNSINKEKTSMNNALLIIQIKDR